MNRFPRLFTTHLLCGIPTVCATDTGSTANGSSVENNDTGPDLSFGSTHDLFAKDLWVIHE